MPLPSFIPSNSDDQWERFCDLLFYDDTLGFWLDISRMNVDKIDITEFDTIFQKAFESIELIENGSIANIDEKRQVGHYWLRTPELAPNQDISQHINNEISKIKVFGEKVLNGDLLNSENKKYTDVFWIGIGGSGLGPKLIVESLQKQFNGLQFHFLDNVDPDGINERLISVSSKLESTLFVVVSKSGGTPEPLIGMEQAINFVENKGLDWRKQAIAVTMVNSELDKIAKKQKWLEIFDLPDWVGGRTSITGAVGLLPTALIGGNVQMFIHGASKMDEITRKTNISQNPAALLALAWFKSGNGKGLRDMVVLPYRDRLEVFSKYLQQLVMESLGKKLNRAGQEVSQGISVYGNKGSTDQHAYVQQLRDGIDNFFVNFIEILGDNNNIKKVNNKKPGDYLSGFLQGTRAALTDAGRQSVNITYKTFDEKTLGSLIALFERTVSLYAEIINVNAYHQPGVEAGKLAASEILVLQEELVKIVSDGKPRSIKTISTLLDNQSQESIYHILRHLSENDIRFCINGDPSNPNSLIISFQP